MKDQHATKWQIQLDTSILSEKEAETLRFLCSAQPRMNYDRTYAPLAAFELRMKITEVGNSEALSDVLQSMPYDDFIKSVYWRFIRQVVLVRDKFKCARPTCRSEHKLEVHHLTYKHHGKEHLYLEDLQCLCGWHHALVSEEAILRGGR